jgi:hypothetical protein
MPAIFLKGVDNGAKTKSIWDRFSGLINMEDKPVKKEEALDKLQRQIDALKTVRAIRRFGATFTKWRRDTEVTIREVFDGDQKHIDDFTSISYGSAELSLDFALSDKELEKKLQRTYEEGLEHAESILASFLDEIKEFWDQKRDIKKRKGVETPEKVTIPWLLNNVPIHLWLAFASSLAGAFLLGIQASRISLVKEIFILTGK